MDQRKNSDNDHSADSHHNSKSGESLNTHYGVLAKTKFREQFEVLIVQIHVASADFHQNIEVFHLNKLMDLCTNFWMNRQA